MGENKHDLLGPSSLGLRHLCPGSANLQRQKEVPEEEESSAAATRGSALHKLAADALGDVDITISLAAIEQGDVNAVNWCVEQCREIHKDFPGILKTEQEISLKDVGIEKGTIDVLIVQPGEGVTVIDHKFGMMEVPPPEYNWQMKAYAWAARNKYGGESVSAVILQPELEPSRRFKEHTFSAEDMAAIGKEIADTVDRCNAEDSPLVKGWWCTGMFCKCTDVCPLWMNAVLGLPQHLDITQHLDTLEPDKRTDLYDTLVAANKWSEKAIAKCQAWIHGGGHVPGYEIRDGRKSRVWGDADVAGPALREMAVDMGVNPDDLFEPEHLKSIAKVEGVVGTSDAVAEKLSPLILHVPGKPVIRPARKKK